MSDYTDEYKRLVLFEYQATQYVQQLEASVEAMTDKLADKEATLAAVDAANNNEVERRQGLQEEVDLKTIKIVQLEEKNDELSKRVAQLRTEIRTWSGVEDHGE
jgi:chromosome segregation ATPase